MISALSDPDVPRMVTGFTASAGAAAPYGEDQDSWVCPGASKTLTSLAIRQSLPMVMRFSDHKGTVVPIAERSPISSVGASEYRTANVIEIRP